MVYPEVLQLFNDEIYLVRISVQTSLIKVAIYEIYGLEWGARPPNLRFGSIGPLSPSRCLCCPLSFKSFISRFCYTSWYLKSDDTVMLISNAIFLPRDSYFLVWAKEGPCHI